MTALSVIIDLILLGVLVACVVFGIKKGFIKSFVGLFKNFIAFLIAVCFSGALGNLISENFVKAPITERLSKSVANLLIDSGVSAEGDVASHIPDFVIDMLNFVHIDVESKFIAPIEESIATNGSTAVGIAAVIAAPIAKVVSVVIAFILLYVVSRILLTVTVKVLDKLCDIPFIRTANGIMGGLLGGACGILYLGMISKVLVFIIGFGSGSELEMFDFLDGFDADKTFILKLFNNINPIKAVLKLGN